jgi:transposase
LPGNYVKKDPPICPECHSKTSFLTTGSYYCIHCDLEFSPTRREFLNVYALTEDGDRQLLRTAPYLTNVTENMSQLNGNIMSSNFETSRVLILKMTLNKILPIKKAARYAGISIRQFYRLRNRFLNYGERSLIDGHCRSGRRSTLPIDLQEQIMTLANANYSLRHMQTALNERGINVSYRTIGRILKRVS